MVTVIMLDALGGNSQTAHGVEKVDAYRFTRNPKHPKFSHLHLLEFPNAEDFNRVSQDLLTAPGNERMYVLVEPETAPADVELAERVKIAEAKSVDAVAEIERITQELEKVKLEATFAIEPNDVEELLAERDALMAALKPFAIGDETPAAVLARVIERANQVPPSQQNVSAVPEKYTELEALAKSLGFSNHPKKPAAALRTEVEAALAKAAQPAEATT